MQKGNLTLWAVTMNAGCGDRGIPARKLRFVRRLPEQCAEWSSQGGPARSSTGARVPRRRLGCLQAGPYDCSRLNDTACCCKCAAANGVEGERCGRDRHWIMRGSIRLQSILVVAGAACLLQVAGHPFADSVAATCPGLPSLQYEVVCYAPSQVAKAERRFSGRALDPSGAVRRYTGLSLTLVSTGRRILPKRSRAVTLLEFDYGTPPEGFPTTPTPSAGVPKWVTVTELAPPFQKVKGMVVMRAGTQGATWQLTEDLPHHNVAIFIVTNEDRATIRHIGRTLLRADER